MSVKLSSGDPSSFFGPLEGQANIFLSHFDHFDGEEFSLLFIFAIDEMISLEQKRGFIAPIYLLFL